MRRLVLALRLGLAPLPAIAQSVTLDVCNTTDAITVCGEPLMVDVASVRCAMGVVGEPWEG